MVWVGSDLNIQVWQIHEEPELVGSIHAHGRGVGTAWSLRTFLIQSILLRMQFSESNTVKIWHYILVVERTQTPNVQATQPQERFSSVRLISTSALPYFSLFSALFLFPSILASHFLLWHHQAWTKNLILIFWSTVGTTTLYSGGSE